MYQVGDIVTIRKDLKRDAIYTNCYMVAGMLQYRGTTHKITHVMVGKQGTPDELCLYRLDMPNNWIWSEEMFVPTPSDDERNFLRR